jgi:hypothetical protein
MDTSCSGQFLISTNLDNQQISILHCNCAAVHLKTQDYIACITDCNHAIKILPFTKVYFRRAQANVILKEIKEVFKDLSLLLQRS